MSQASTQKEVAVRTVLAHKAYELMTDVMPSRFKRMPLLLPGIRQECAEESFWRYTDDANDPLMDEIVEPFRYRSSMAISLAGLRGFPDEALLNDAQKSCYFMIENRKDAIIPGLNCRQTSVVVEAIIKKRFRKGDSETEISNRIFGILKEIQYYKTIGMIAARKEREWSATCYATLAFLTSSRNERDNALHQMKRNLEALVMITGGVPDFVILDMPYRLALESVEPGMFINYVNELGKSVAI